jgi:Lrp/AsnC family transcriptional regulator for asnA, asnC and gidA
MALHYEIDNTDIGIMNVLLQNANTPYTEIAQKLFVSPGTVHVRMKKLERLGIVKPAQLQISTKKIG